MRAAAALALLAGASGAVVLLVWWRGRPMLEAVATDVDAMKPAAAAAPRAAEGLHARALQNRNVRALLAMIRYAEGTSAPEGYRMLFGGELFDSFADHPRQVVTRLSRGRPLKSTAAGAYQILERTWDDLRRTLPLPDFSPRSQDLAAVELIRRRGALDAAQAGQLNRAVELIRREWASLPGAGYGQPEKQFSDLVDVYARAGGVVA